MKITPIQRQQMISAYGKSRVQGISQAQGTPLRPDAVEISPEGASFSETFRAVMQAMQQESPKAQERHAAVSKQVQEGEYDIGAEDIAGAMLRGLMIDKEV